MNTDEMAKIILGQTLIDIDSPKQKTPPSQMPSLASMVKGLAAEAGTWILAGAPVSAKEVARERLATCGACEFFINSRCSKCGCYMAAKASMATAKCPLGKWSR